MKRLMMNNNHSQKEMNKSDFGHKGKSCPHNLDKKFVYIIWQPIELLTNQHDNQVHNFIV